MPHVRDKPDFVARREKDIEVAKHAWSVYKIALKHKRYVAWEWPWRCAHWETSVGRDVRNHALMNEYRIDGCAFGLRVDDSTLRKPWRIMTNMRALERECEGRTCQGGHNHGQCRGQRAKLSASYPDQLCDCIHSAFRSQLASVGHGIWIMKDWSRCDSMRVSHDSCAADAAYANAIINAWCDGSSQAPLDLDKSHHDEMNELCNELLHELHKNQVPMAPQRTNVKYDPDMPVRSVLIGLYTVRGMWDHRCDHEAQVEEDH